MTYADYPEFEYRMAYEYCENDLSDEVVGMWVSFGNSSNEENNMFIQTFNENGKSTYTGFGEIDGEIVVKKESNYKVVGDACFQEINGKYIAWKVSYSQNGTSLGDIMTNTNAGYTSTWLRIKQSLNLAGNAYDYNNTYVSNVKGLDEDMTMMGYTFNIGKMEGKNLDKMLKHLLFAVEFPNANTIKYQYHYNGQNLVFEAPIVVDGNKVTIKMSEFSSYYRDVDMYMFQDQDDCQLHMYMPTYAFINYFANMDLAALAVTGDIDLTDAAAVEAIFDRMDERVESINVSFIFKAAK